MTRKGCLLVLLALTGPGCLTPTQTVHLEDEAKKMPPVQIVEAPPPSPIVTPDQVNETNGPEIAQALARELDQADHEQSGDLPPADTKAGETKP